MSKLRTINHLLQYKGVAKIKTITRPTAHKAIASNTNDTTARRAVALVSERMTERTRYSTYTYQSVTSTRLHIVYRILEWRTSNTIITTQRKSYALNIKKYGW